MKAKRDTWNMTHCSICVLHIRQLRRNRCCVSIHVDDAGDGWDVGFVSCSEVRDVKLSDEWLCLMKTTGGNREQPINRASISRSKVKFAITLEGCLASTRLRIDSNMKKAKWIENGNTHNLIQILALLSRRRRWRPLPMRCIHATSIRRANAGRTRRRLLRRT